MWADSSILVGICVLGLALFFLFFSRLRQRPGRSWNLESVDSDPDITEIIEQSIAERSTYELLLDNDDQPLALEGVPMEWGKHSTLLIDLPAYRDTTLEFASKSFTVYFRIGKRDHLQFFYFQATAQGLERRKLGSGRQLFLRLERPKRLYRGQRRRHFRLQPGSAARVTVSLSRELHGDEESRLLTDVPVDDISAGGLRITADDLPHLQILAPDDTVLLEVKLRPCSFPAEDAMVPAAIRFRSVILENTIPTKGKRLMRFKFQARAVLQPGEKRLHFTQDLEVINEDLSRWIHACNRGLLRQWRLSLHPGNKLKQAEDN